MSNKFQQCVLEKDNVQQIAYIEKKYAKVGNLIKINKDNVWDLGWKVIKVGFESSLDISPEQSIKRHKNNTGDSLPKKKRRK